MVHLPAIISDLAVILLIAGVTTLIFRKIGQPQVLGYIVAGILAGPGLSILTISDAANIQAWSEIGVIFLMFALGLEFSFYKLKSVGSTAFIACGIVISGMIVVGYAAGCALGWKHMDSLFLGCMLSVSSTTIIIKAFDDLKLRGKRFTEIVFGILVVEDIASILMMVILSTVATATGGLSLEELAYSIARLIFFLVLWFVMGMYLVPSFFKKADALMNGETLIVVAIGLCLAMVVLVSKLGFSSALGAFIMGSLIAEAPSAEKIEHLLAPVKDLFGAVFFVSVGMMVDPLLLAEYAAPVAVLVVVTVAGRLALSVFGVLASGQDLETSAHCGVSLAQIGEFSFIIASLGLSLGAIDSFLYPIVVAVSVITTFTTPFCIKSGDKVHVFLEKALPEAVKLRIRRYCRGGIAGDDEHWKMLLRSYGVRMLVYMTLLGAVAAAATYLEAYLGQGLGVSYAGYIAALAAFAAMAPVLRIVLANRAENPELYAVLWLKGRGNHLPLVALVAGKILLAAISLYYIANRFLGLNGFLAFAVIAACAYFISSSDWLMGEYLRMEARFLVNLNEKHMQGEADSGADGKSGWLDGKLKLAVCQVAQSSPLAGRSLNESAFREQLGCNVVRITDSAGRITDFPGGDALLTQASELLALGTAEQMDVLERAAALKELGIGIKSQPVSLREFLLSDRNETDSGFRLMPVRVDSASPVLGTSLKRADVRGKWKCLALGLERGAYTIANPNVSLVFEENDLLWLLGTDKMVKALLREEIL